MADDPVTIAHVRHRDVVRWRRDRFERALLRRDAVTAVFHGTREVQVTFRCDHDEAGAVLDTVASVTRFPVTAVTWQGEPSRGGPPEGQPP